MTGCEHSGIAPCGFCTCGQSGHGNGHEIGCAMSDYRPAKAPTATELAEILLDQGQVTSSNEILVAEIERLRERIAGLELILINHRLHGCKRGDD